ncbi:MAG: SLBB domain-containing protein [Bacteroidales bacterium]|nr:SLBB domain-containing protein [Bacteroidales bacterium]
MRKKLLFLLIAFLTLGAQQAFAQMSDEQIITYITEGIAAGKTERQIGTELMAKGVTTSQLQRLLKAYKSGNLNMADTNVLPSNKLGTTTKERKNVAENEEESSSATNVSDGSLNRKVKKITAEADGEEIEDTPEEDVNPLIDEEGEKIIYGHKMFSAKNLSFEPNLNMPTPEDYVLGPGDEVIIDIWGLNEANITQKISPEGRINISQVGPIQLSGLTVKQANGKVKTALSKAYSSLKSGASKMSLVLGNLRSIQVNVLGEVETPGTYRVSSFTNLFNALYRAGGVTPVGSLRNVKVVRGGETFADVDIYEYLFNGRMDVNVPLREGDVIIVPAYSALVSVTGAIKRPMYYEMKEGEPVGALIKYAGGFSGNAYKEEVGVERNDGRTNSMYTVSSDKFDTFALSDGDAVLVSGSEVEVFSNRVEVKGAVYRPGKFEIGGDIKTVGQLVAHAGGVLEDAFLNRAQIVREKPDRSIELLPVPLKGVLEGTADDILLQRGDVLIVSNINEIEPKGDIVVTGYVANPGKYQYADNTTVEDIILIAGGLVEGASSAKVDIARRIDISSSTAASDTLAQVFSVSIKDGLIDEGDGGFVLRPNDVVSVRRSPTYIEQRNVTVTGEVTFPGQYSLVANNERVSDLMKRAGGATPNGNVHGAMLKRKINQYERNVRNAMARIVTQTVSGKDTLDVNKLKVSEIYTVGLELDKALEHPGSDYDIVLRDGDELIIPEVASTVRVQGEVLYPNTVHYISGKPIRYYVRQSGGYSTKARRAKTYVIYMNGTVAVGSGARLEPGCEIVVPGRSDKDKLTTGEWLGIGTSAASITTMVATLVSLFRN